MYSVRNRGLQDSWKWETLSATEEKQVVLKANYWPPTWLLNGSSVPSRGGFKGPRAAVFEVLPGQVEHYVLSGTHSTVAPGLLGGGYGRPLTVA